MRVAFNLLIVVASIMEAAIAFAVDPEPHMKVKVCNPAETNCAQVSNDSVYMKLRDSTGANYVGQRAMADSVPVTIASDQPLEGNGSLVFGEKVFSTTVDISAATAGTDNPILYLRNPSGSSKKYLILSVTGGTTVTNVSMEFKIYANPTVSANGTAQTEASMYVGSSSVATGIATTQPTVTTLGTVVSGSVHGQNTIGVDIARPSTLAIQANNAILITASPSSNNRNAQIAIVWAEFDP